MISGIVTTCASLGRTIGNGNIVSQERTVSDFDGVISCGIGNVNIYPAKNFKVVVITDSNIQDMIGIKSGNGTLHIDNKLGIFIPTELSIDVYMPELKNISSKGTGNIKIHNGSIPDLEMKISGTGNIDAQDYQAETVNLLLTGTGSAKIWVTDTLTGRISGTGNVDAQNYQVQTADLTLTGTGSAKIWVADTLTGRISGTGSIDTQSYQVQTANLTLSGAGGAKIWVTDTLAGKISGTGSILYKGNPSVDVKRTGTGKVKPLA
jgi:hypothetical protein